MIIIDIKIIKTNYIIFIIFFLLSIGIINNKENDNIITKLTTIKCLIISFIVSLDSLSVGIALGLTKNNVFNVCIIISIISTIITFIGIILGKRIKEQYNSKSKYIGAMILFLIAIKYLIYG